MAVTENTIISVEGLRKHYPVTKGAITKKLVGTVKAIDDISFTINKGETFSLVGESGCGKTTTTKMILMSEKPTAGIVKYEGADMAEFSTAARKEFKSSVQAVFQDPWSSLNPKMRVRDLIAEPIVTHEKATTKEIQDRVTELLGVVGLHPFHGERYPHEFSGGQRQRIAIARALSTRPKIMVLDEPVSALDVSIRAQVLNLLKELQQTYGISYLMIAHNLATVKYMSHQVAVMYLGKIVELGSPKEIFSNPQHPYTKALISAALPSHPRLQRDEIILAGEVPSPINPPSGCVFRTRCPNPSDDCKNGNSEMGLIEVSPGHWVDQCCVNCG
jgi:oligopeptide/dipeptide ABC transporter ATP-binding protein